VFLINVPIAFIGLVAAAALLSEFRAPERPGLDLTGVAASVVGLVALTYGLIRAGQDGWGNPGALLIILIGIAVMVGFIAWERRLTRRPDGQPLLDMTLFSSASFTWGAIFAALSFLRPLLFSALWTSQAVSLRTSCLADTLTEPRARNRESPDLRRSGFATGHLDELAHRLPIGTPSDVRTTHCGFLPLSSSPQRSAHESRSTPTDRTQRQWLTR
jgi:hypothetical protein